MDVGLDGIPVGLLPSALDPDDDGVSVTWLEYFGGQAAQQLQSVREVMSKRRRIRKNNGLAVLNAGKIIAVGQSLGTELRVEHDPDFEAGKENPAHSLIIGMRPDHDDLKIRLVVLALVRIEPGISDPA
jgi:hypothetical protein